MLAALAREVLLRMGPEAYAHLEEQAKRFCTPNDEKVAPDICAKALEVVGEVFTMMADGVPDTPPESAP
jgi:hypothetical protein